MFVANKFHAAAELVDVVKKIKSEFPTFRVSHKDEYWLMKVIDVFLKVITFGRMKTFLTGYTTTIGTKVYVPRSWVSNKTSLEKAVTLRHEAVHMRQRARMGAILYSLTYLFWVFPVGLALGRRNLEQEAYVETMKAYVEYYGVERVEDPEVRARIISHFTSADYFWTWPFRKDCEHWYDGVVASLTPAEVPGAKAKG